MFLYEKLVEQSLKTSITIKKTSINILQAMRFVDKSWDNVSAVIIKRCFKKTGYIKNIETEEKAQMPAAISQEDWNRINVNISVSHYIEIDEDVATTGTLTSFRTIRVVEKVNTFGKIKLTPMFF